MTHKIRIHKGYMETRHGTDAAFVVDDPLSPLNREEVVKILMDKLGYEDDEDDFDEDDFDEDDEDYENRKGSDDTGSWAYFDYWGYSDVEIPESIVKRIMKGE